MVFVGAFLMGVILGLIPYKIAKNRGKEKFANIAMAVCIIGSLIAGIFLSIPACLICTIIAFYR